MRWTLPAAVRQKRSTPSPLGRTIAFPREVLPDGSLRLVEGRECLAQGLETRLVTSPGEYAARPDFGAGIRAQVKRSATRSAAESLRARMIAQARADDRVRDVPAVNVSRIEDGLRVRLTLNVLGEVITLRPIEVT